MTSVAPLPYSKKEIARAGAALCSQMSDPSKIQEYADVFRIAHLWRGSHIVPMQRVAEELRRNVGKVDIRAVTAARMKRMSSIRKKLQRQSTLLTQIQDIGGCRAIVGTMADLDGLIAHYRNGGSRHEIKGDTNYVISPRESGYRSHHVILSYCAPNKDTECLNGRRIEVQLRTELQHSWATAVEAIGLVRREDLKAGEGNPDWLRLFRLVAAEFCEAECQVTMPGLADKQARRLELVELNRKLKVISTLQNLKQAFRVAERYKTNADYYLVKYDHAAQQVEITGYTSMATGNVEYDKFTNDGGSGNLTTVLVEVSGVENLVAAYPNYFGDVTLFTQNLSRSMQGVELISRLTAIEGQSSGVDLSFIRNYDAHLRTVRRRPVLR